MNARPKRKRLRASAQASEPALSAEAIEEIETAIDYAFRDKPRLMRAMTHPSALSATDAAKHSNQRLEFLGDRVLGLVIAERLFERYPNEREGDLAPRLNRLVRKEACAAAFKRLDIARHILMAENEIANGGQARESTLGDACEALIAAIYLDGGFGKARAFIERAWSNQFSQSGDRIRHPKSLLQEWAQANGYDLPRYETISRQGPDHAPIFRIRVSISDALAAEGESSSKADAELEAAEALLERVDPQDIRHDE